MILRALFTNLLLALATLLHAQHDPLTARHARINALYEAHKGKYKDLKEALAADIEAFVAPMREKRGSISDDDVRAVLKEGAARAHELAAAKMVAVRKAIGLTI